MRTEVLINVIGVALPVAVLSAMLAASLLRRYAPERRRLRTLAARTQDESEWRTSHVLTDEPSALAERICRVMPRSSQRMGEMRQRLVAAGFRSRTAPAIYAASQIVSALVCGVAVAVLSGNGPAGLLSLVAGFGLPGVWLSFQVRRRARIIRGGLADVLDLLIVCLESGCGLDQAILKTGDELALVCPPLSDELALVANEIRAGKPRAEAFVNLADRTGIDDVRSIVMMLIQTDRYGTSIAQALRTHADLLRTRRRMRAEERAAKANVKLVFPLVLCLFPAFYILTLGPALLHFVSQFNEALSGFK